MLLEIKMGIRFWLVQLSSLITLTLFLSLGTWQLERGNVKHQIETQQITYIDSEVARGIPTAPFEAWRYQQIQLQGRYQPSKQFILDNQIRDRIAGYSVLTPFYSEPDRKWFLVDRGWIAQSSNRTQIPELVLDATTRTISGSVYVPYDDSFTLGGIAEGEDFGWPRRIQFVDYQALGERLGLSLLPFTLRLDGAEPDGYRRDWAANQMRSQKHYGYAFQWYAMALAVLVLWWLYSIRPLLRNRR
jgi:surfeit locus 1 family protein